MPTGGVIEQPAWVELYSAWATTQKGGFLYGRVDKREPLPLPKAGEGLAAKRHETLQDLDVHALANAQVRLSGYSGVWAFHSRQPWLSQGADVTLTAPCWMPAGNAPPIEEE